MIIRTLDLGGDKFLCTSRWAKNPKWGIRFWEQKDIFARSPRHPPRQREGNVKMMYPMITTCTS